MSIDPAFLKVFNAISKDKTLVFTNAGRKKAFEISEPDSIIHDKKGGFMAGGPYKDLIISINETGTDTLELDRPNKIFVHRDPEKDINGISINFGNLWYHEEYLPKLLADTMFNETVFNDMYVFRTSIKSKQKDDVITLFVSENDGIVAFETYCNEIWLRKN